MGIRLTRLDSFSGNGVNTVKGTKGITNLGTEIDVVLAPEVLNITYADAQNLESGNNWNPGTTYCITDAQNIHPKLSKFTAQAQILPSGNVGLSFWGWAVVLDKSNSPYAGQVFCGTDWKNTDAKGAIMIFDLSNDVWIYDQAAVTDGGNAFLYNRLGDWQNCTFKQLNFHNRNATSPQFLNCHFQSDVFDLTNFDNLTFYNFRSTGSNVFQCVQDGMAVQDVTIGANNYLLFPATTGFLTIGSGNTIFYGSGTYATSLTYCTFGNLTTITSSGAGANSCSKVSFCDGITYTITRNMVDETVEEFQTRLNHFETFAPLTGTTITISSDTTYSNLNVCVNPAATIAALTVNFPATRKDGQILRLGFTNQVTAITLAANGAAAIVSNITQATRGTSYLFYYQASDNKWYIV